MPATAKGPERFTGPGRDGRERHQPAAAATATPHLLHYLRVLSKRRWTVIGTLVAVVGTVAYMTARTVPEFEARAQLMIEVERARVIVFADDDKNEGADESRDYQETQRRILQSRVLASRTLEAIDLWQHPEFGGGPQEEPSALQKRIDSVWAFFAKLPTTFSKSPNYSRGGLKQPEGPDPDEELGFKEREEQTKAIDAFLSRLTVTPVGTSRLVDVGFRSTDPKLAAAVANGLTEAYIAQNREFKATVAKEAADWLADQLTEHRKQLRLSQENLQRYREQRPDASGGDGPDLVLQRLESLNSALMAARTDRIQKEIAYNQVQVSQGNQAALDSLPLVQANASVQGLKRELDELQEQDVQLRQKFGEKHPERLKLRLSMQTAQERLNTEMARVLETARTDYRAAQEQEATLVRAVETQKREATIASGKRAEYENLARAASTDQDIFATLLQRTKETGVTTGLVASNIRVVDPASVPQSPVSPNPRKNLLLALIGGMILAVGFASFAEYMDKGISSPDQIKSELGLACIGLVPVIAGRKQAADPLLDKGVPPDFQEAFRSLRTSVLFASHNETVRTILVTSTGPGEGKTLVASNLAMSLAQTGQRVLLVDADMRRPRVHKIFKRSQEPGLSEFTAGRLSESKAIIRTAAPGLWLLPAGAIPPNPSELLSSERCRRLIKELSEAFDWVIIDSPPVMAVTDASLLAHMVAGVLFVVAAGQATAPAAANALDQLDAAQARFLGAVLNKVNFKRNAFYYADYYRREYADYYTKPTADARGNPSA